MEEKYKQVDLGGWISRRGQEYVQRGWTKQQSVLEGEIWVSGEMGTGLEVVRLYKGREAMDSRHGCVQWLTPLLCVPSLLLRSRPPAMHTTQNCKSHVTRP